MITPASRQGLKWCIVLLLMCSHPAEAQQSNSLTLDSCLALANQNYPLIQQYTLIEKARDFSIANAQKGVLPQFNVSGQATYQSEVTKVPVSLPNVNIPTIAKDQYRLYGELSQSITDLFTVKDQREYINTRSEIETQQTKVELYKLRERINSLFFGILVIDAQIQQTSLLKKDIQNGIAKANVAIANGVALKSTADNLKAELLKAEQRTIELSATRKGFTDMLALFTGIPIDENTILEKPHLQMFTSAINRPELRLFDLQKKSFEVQEALITAKNRPRISVFFQGGLGRPALNMLKPGLEGYYIGGLRLNWNFAAFYTYKNEKKILDINRSAIDLQRETFLFNTSLALKQQHAEITKMQELIETDRSIVALRESVKHSTQQQLVYGTATTNDYLIALNAEDQARQSLILHQIQLLMTAYNIRTTAGSW